MTDRLLVESLSKRYGNVVALEEVSLQARAGEITAILGPSGSGKSTLLNLCAGIVAPDAGRVILEGKDITDLPIEERDMGVVFQGLCLFPHLSVLENVAFPLRTRRHRGKVGSSPVCRAHEVLELVGLRGLEQRRPKELSGGQQQRVAIARALAFRPRVLLLDEPLANLDPNLKDQLLQDIRRLRTDLGVSVLFVTHDQQEAMTIADQIAIIYEGRVQQVGTPSQIYDHPKNQFVATFVGESNMVLGTITRVDAGCCHVDGPAGEIRIAGIDYGRPQDNVCLMLRPEHIRIEETTAPPNAANHVAGTVSEVTFLGSSTRLSVRISASQEWRVYVSHASDCNQLAPDTSVQLSWRAEDVRLVRLDEAARAVMVGSR